MLNQPSRRLAVSAITAVSVSRDTQTRSCDAHVARTGMPRRRKAASPAEQLPSPLPPPPPPLTAAAAAGAPFAAPPPFYPTDPSLAYGYSYPTPYDSRYYAPYPVGDPGPSSLAYAAYGQLQVQPQEPIQLEAIPSHYAEALERINRTATASQAGEGSPAPGDSASPPAAPASPQQPHRAAPQRRKRAVEMEDDAPTRAPPLQKKRGKGKGKEARSSGVGDDSPAPTPAANSARGRKRGRRASSSLARSGDSDDSRSDDDGSTHRGTSEPALAMESRGGSGSDDGDDDDDDDGEGEQHEEEEEEPEPAPRRRGGRRRLNSPSYVAPPPKPGGIGAGGGPGFEGFLDSVPGLKGLRVPPTVPSVLKGAENLKALLLASFVEEDDDGDEMANGGGALQQLTPEQLSELERVGDPCVPLSLAAQAYAQVDQTRYAVNMRRRSYNPSQTGSTRSTPLTRHSTRSCLKRKSKRAFSVTSRTF